MPPHGSEQHVLKASVPNYLSCVDIWLVIEIDPIFRCFSFSVFRFVFLFRFFFFGVSSTISASWTSSTPQSSIFPKFFSLIGLRLIKLRLAAVPALFVAVSLEPIDCDQKRPSQPSSADAQNLWHEVCLCYP